MNLPGAADARAGLTGASRCWCSSASPSSTATLAPCTQENSHPAHRGPANNFFYRPLFETAMADELAKHRNAIVLGARAHAHRCFIRLRMTSQGLRRVVRGRVDAGRPQQSGSSAVWWSDRADRAGLAFSLATISTAAFATCGLSMLRSAARSCSAPVCNGSSSSRMRALSCSASAARRRDRPRLQRRRQDLHCRRPADLRRSWTRNRLC